MGDFKSSEIRMLTGALKADWIQLPVERYLIEFPSGVFRSIGRLPGQRSYKSLCSCLLSNLWKILVFRGLCPAHSVARCLHDGDEGGWL